MTTRLRLAAHVLVALLPNVVKRPVYRHVCGYRIGTGVRIGCSVIAVGSCAIGDGTVIGHGNAMVDIERLEIGDHVRIGTLNVVRGGDLVRIGRWSVLLRRNELNSIVAPDAVNPTDPRLLIGAGCVVTDGHRLDFTDRIELGERVIVGGRNSSLWTHNRQRTAPVSVGERTYIGSETKVAPGSSIPARSIVALGSVVAGRLVGDGTLIGGVPATVLRPLAPADLDLVDRPTHPDAPDPL